MFRTAGLAFGEFVVKLGTAQLQTLAAIFMVFGGRASCWFHANARDFGILAEQMADAVVSTDLAFISILTTVGIIRAAIPPDLVLEVLVGAARLRGHYGSGQARALHIPANRLISQQGNESTKPLRERSICARQSRSRKLSI